MLAVIQILINAMNTFLSSVFASHNSFFISTLRKTVSADEAVTFFNSAREKGVNDSYLMNIVKVVTDNGTVSLNKLI